jgi:hypothetical protein
MAVYAAGFILGVMDKYQENDLFLFHDAIMEWDEDHRAAFLAWCKDPWWAVTDK